MTSTPTSPAPATSASPRWLQDLLRLLPVRSQFVLSGAIRDSVLSPMGGALALLPLQRALWQALQAQGYALMLVYDPVDGVRVYPNEPALRDRAQAVFDLRFAADAAQQISLESLALLMRRLCTQRELRCALVLDYASRMVRAPATLAEAEQRFFVAAEKAAWLAAPMTPPGTALPPLFNPVVWLVHRAQDLPSWFALDNDRCASLVASLPDYETRLQAASQLAPLFTGYLQAEATQQQRFVQALADGTEGMPLSALADLTELATRQGLGVDAVDDALRCYKVGVLDNPWKKDYLRSRIAGAQSFIEERVQGQRPAVVKTLDILKRSVMGLTGAQARSAGTRPRGVLFFAGPTGVGKTELAKTLTQLVFGNDRAYIRFDMSEFAAEHASARLLGAPPGYVGFDAGGELTNAVRERPFSVVLFDEIEKAHPRILDKFLQILEDGRLTDGRGETTYFSETILVFTSNLGIFVEDEQGQRVQSVRPGDPYEQVQMRVRAAIESHFKFRLARPEILNRMGDNIVVFDFIRPEVAQRIFDGMLRNVARRMQDEFRLRLSIDPTVHAELLRRCTADLSNGGRGIGNALESHCINPLSRALFAQTLTGRERVVLQALRDEDGVSVLDLRLE